MQISTAAAAGCTFRDLHQTFRIGPASIAVVIVLWSCRGYRGTWRPCASRTPTWPPADRKESCSFRSWSKCSADPGTTRDSARPILDLRSKRSSTTLCTTRRGIRGTIVILGLAGLMWKILILSLSGLVRRGACWLIDCLKYHTGRYVSSDLHALYSYLHTRLRSRWRFFLCKYLFTLRYWQIPWDNYNWS